MCRIVQDFCLVLHELVAFAHRYLPIKKRAAVLIPDTCNQASSASTGHHRVRPYGMAILWPRTRPYTPRHCGEPRARIALGSPCTSSFSDAKAPDRFPAKAGVLVQCIHRRVVDDLRNRHLGSGDRGMAWRVAASQTNGTINVIGSRVF